MAVKEEASLVNARTTVEAVRSTLSGEVPEELSWVNVLSTSHLIQFTVEAHESLAHVRLTGNPSEVLRVLAAWKETATRDAK